MTINDFIRGRGRPAPPPDRETEIERELAEARVALDVLNGTAEWASRIKHGLDKVPDYGGGPRGLPLPGGPSQTGTEWIREQVRHRRGYVGRNYL